MTKLEELEAAAEAAVNAAADTAWDEADAAYAAYDAAWDAVDAYKALPKAPWESVEMKDADIKKLEELAKRLYEQKQKDKEIEDDGFITIYESSRGSTIKKDGPRILIYVQKGQTVSVMPLTKRSVGIQ
jgi:predicted Zn-dependent protease